MCQPASFVVENQFTHEDIDFHNIEFHFIVEPIGEMPEKMIEGQLKQTCEWIALDNLVNLDVVPVFWQRNCQTGVDKLHTL